MDTEIHSSSVRVTEKARRTRDRYRGEKARQYERNRVAKPKWRAEGAMVEDLLSTLDPGARVLDCPCGTGRFIPFAASRSLEYVGVDSSPDMLAEARRKVAGGSVVLSVGSIFGLEFQDAAFDAAICIRFANLIKPTDLKLALSELQRVTRSRVFLNLRVGDKDQRRYHDPHEIATVEDALASGWVLSSNVPIHEAGYRMLTLERVDRPARQPEAWPDCEVG